MTIDPSAGRARTGVAMPMMISTMFFLIIVVICVLLGPKTKGKRLPPDLDLIKRAAHQPIEVAA